MNWLDIIITVVVIGLISGVIYWGVSKLQIIPEPINQIVRVVIVVVAALAMIMTLMGRGPHFIRIG